MKKPLIIRPRADLDLARHYLFLSEFSPRKAEQFRVAIRGLTRQIRTDPSGGTVLTYPGLPDIDLRFRRPAGFRKYLVIYQIADDCVYLLRILHGSQNLETELRPPSID